MQDPKQVRLNDAQDPDRADKFAAALKRSAASGNSVIRELVDAYIRFVQEHGRSPTFPVDLISASLPKPRPRSNKS